ncbi:hypothetical protein SAMN02745221_00732 [Thermosyntropha lipolytica DSM 11003]|uniref:Uncharacterized protein n=1 Tax=Thermosyntropha lipolytica DSM 11003 TaxID=1123382 RepID=A0A1M5LPN3_9FIRM|nr:hypothetical protein [Thermosyntropha lipolytica]SHG67102.1 hypothetical protein SAMN02745221_00732 [Thermosyntropha lipolytica DSM 11003]
MAIVGIKNIKEVLPLAAKDIEKIDADEMKKILLSLKKTNPKEG